MLIMSLIYFFFIFEASVNPIPKKDKGIMLSEIILAASCIGSLLFVFNLAESSATTECLIDSR